MVLMGNKAKALDSNYSLHPPPRFPPLTLSPQNNISISSKEILKVRDTITTSTTQIQPILSRDASLAMTFRRLISTILDQRNDYRLKLMNQTNGHHKVIATLHQATTLGHQTIAEHHQVLEQDPLICRNNLPPISRIPPEVLHQIFFIASRDVSGRGVEWIILTHVCHDWRTLAMTSPSLWSNPPFHNPYWAKEMLIRSKAAYLTFEADATLFTHSGIPDNFVEALETCMPRIKCLKLEFPLYSANLLEYLPASVPNLESLSLQSQAWHSVNPVVLKQGSLLSTGHLRHVDLTGICIDWKLHLPSSLTSLKLRYIHSSKRPTMVEVWDSLNRMPVLETLELIDALPTLGIPMHSDRTIFLNRLRNLILHAGISETISFLQTVTYPHDAVANIQCRQVRETDYFDLNDIIRLLGRSLQGCSAQIESLQIGQYSLGPCVGLKIRIPISNSNNDLLQGSPNHPTFHFRANWYRIGWDEEMSLQAAEKMFTDIFRQFPFDSVQHISLEGLTRKFSPETLLDTVGSLTLLQTMEVHLGPSLLHALQSTLVDDPLLPVISFPGLRQMSVVETVFYDKPQPSRGKICVEDLARCLIWREQRNAMLKRLELKLCFEVNEDKVGLLKCIVPEVEWHEQDEESWD